MELSQEQRAFRPIEENPIILELSQCQYIREIHGLLKDKFGLPEYYGENWDALWDCLDGLFDDREAFTVKVCGFYAMSEELQEACTPMLEVLEELEQETPNLHVEILP